MPLYMAPAQLNMSPFPVCDHTYVLQIGLPPEAPVLYDATSQSVHFEPRQIMVDHNGHAPLPSSDEHYMQDSIGVPMDAFLTYCFLQRAGYVVRRSPCIWTINEGRLVDVHRHWASAWQDSARIWAANGPRPHSTDGSSPLVASEASAGPASALNGSSGMIHSHAGHVEGVSALRARLA